MWQTVQYAYDVPFLLQAILYCFQLALHLHGRSSYLCSGECRELNELHVEATPVVSEALSCFVSSLSLSLQLLLPYNGRLVRGQRSINSHLLCACTSDQKMRDDSAMLRECGTVGRIARQSRKIQDSCQLCGQWWLGEMRGSNIVVDPKMEKNLDKLLRTAGTFAKFTCT